ncbi:hypothetical protein Tco_1457861 [Tanacetum coccineum]
MRYGGICFHCKYDTNPNSLNFSDYPPQPQYETYSCELCGNDAHYGYDCPPQVPFVYNQNPCFDQNFNNNFPLTSPNFSQQNLVCKNCGGFHATFQCQPMNQNFNYSNSFGFDQIQPPQQFDNHQLQEIPEVIPFIESKEWIETNNELYTMMEDFMKRMNQQREQEALLAAQREQELREQEQATQEKEESPQNSDFRQLIEEMCGTKVCEEQKQKMENMMLDLLKDCRKKELYCIHNNVEDLIESALNSKLLLINLNSQHLDKEKQEVKNVEGIIPLNKTPQISSVNAIAPDLPTEEPDNSLSVGDEHLSTISKTESDKVIKSSVENLVPIPRESEGISDDTCDVPVCENSSTFDALKNHSLILSDSNDDGTSSDDDDSEDIEYVKASPPDSELVSLEETFSDHKEETSSGSTTTHADNSLPEYDSFHFEIEPDQGELTNVVMETILGEPRVHMLNILPTQPTLDSDFTPLDDSLGFGLEVYFPSGSRNKIFDPGIFIEVQSERLLSRDEFGILSSPLLSHRDKIISDFSKSPMMISEGDIPHLDVSQPMLISDFDSEGDIIFSNDLLNDDHIPEYEHFTFDIEPDAPVINNFDELNEDEFFDPVGGEIDVSQNIKDDDSFAFFVRTFIPYRTYLVDSPLLLSTESEDTIFHPDIST